MTREQGEGLSVAEVTSAPAVAKASASARMAHFRPCSSVVGKSVCSLVVERPSFAYEVS